MLLAGHAIDRFATARAVRDSQPFVPMYPIIATDGRIIYATAHPTDPPRDYDSLGYSHSDDEDESELDDTSDSDSSTTLQ